MDFEPAEPASTRRSLLGAAGLAGLLGTAVAAALSAGFIPIRKPKKLPHDTHAIEYGLEYGTDKLEVHTDAVTDGQRVLMVDDLLATGGTMEAGLSLIRKIGGDPVACVFVIELLFLSGRSRLDAPSHSLLKVD